MIARAVISPPLVALAARCGRLGACRRRPRSPRTTCALRQCALQVCNALIERARAFIEPNEVFSIEASEAVERLVMALKVRPCASARKAARRRRGAARARAHPCAPVLFPLLTLRAACLRVATLAAPLLRRCSATSSRFTLRTSSSRQRRSRRTRGRCRTRRFSRDSTHSSSGAWTCSTSSRRSRSSRSSSASRCDAAPACATACPVLPPLLCLGHRSRLARRGMARHNRLHRQLGAREPALTSRRCAARHAPSCSPRAPPRARRLCTAPALLSPRRWAATRVRTSRSPSRRTSLTSPRSSPPSRRSATTCSMWR